MIHNLPYSWYTYTPSKYSLHHASLKCIQEDWLPSTIDFNSKSKARLQIQKVIHSLPLLFFSFVQNSGSICVAFIFLSRKKKQKLDLRGYLAILWPFKKMARGRYQNTALRHDPKDADIWYFMGTSHIPCLLGNCQVCKWWLLLHGFLLLISPRGKKAQILCRVLGSLLQSTAALYWHISIWTNFSKVENLISVGEKFQSIHWKLQGLTLALKLHGFFEK